MKIPILIAFLLVVGCSSQKKIESTTVSTLSQPSKPRSFVPLTKYNGDTTRFMVDNFITNKQNYLNKPFSNLIDDIQLPVFDYIQGSSAHNTEISPFIILKFNKPTEEDNKISQNKLPLTLIVQWGNPVSMKEVNDLIKNNNYKWTKEVKDYFNKQNVGDIKIQNYMVKK
jgi:hypothetical protein